MTESACLPDFEDIPSGWQLTRLKATIRSCQNGLWGDDADGEHDIICVRVADFDRTRRRVRLTDPTYRSIPGSKLGHRLIQPGDLLIEKSGGGEQQPVGTVVLFDHTERAVCSNFVARMVLETQHSSVYFCYLHHALYGLGISNRSIKQTTGIQNLDTESYFNETVPLPPRSTQVAIANFLDHKTAAIDVLIAKKERLIELLQEKRKALITQAVTKGLDPNVPMKDSGIEWLGKIPAHWAMRPLKHLSPRISGRLVYQPAQYFADEGVPFLMGNNVTERGIVWDGVKLIPENINRRFAHHSLRVGDVVTVRVGAPGVTCVVPKEADGLNCGSLMIIRRGAQFESNWLAYVMNSPIIKTQIDLVQYGAAQEQININDAVNFAIPLPDRIEQARIAKFLDEQVDRLSNLCSKLEASVKSLNEYRQALISAAVTGKLPHVEEERGGM